jgi:hypothetical protein
MLELQQYIPRFPLCVKFESVPLQQFAVCLPYTVQTSEDPGGVFWCCLSDGPGKSSTEPQAIGCHYCLRDKSSARETSSATRYTRGLAYFSARLAGCHDYSGLRYSASSLCGTWKHAPVSCLPCVYLPPMYQSWVPDVHEYCF